MNSLLAVLLGNPLLRRLTWALGLIGAALGALSLYGRSQRRQALANERARAAKEAARRTTAGRSAAQVATDRLRAGDSPQSIIDRNNASWRRR